jgi:hypothetical protein
MTPGDATQARSSAVRPTRTMTPRAQMVRVLVGATFAIMVGAGPAIAWDVSTQPPRAEVPSPWAPPSPWKTAGEHMKEAVKGIARVYLPRSRRVIAEDPASSAMPVAPLPVPPAPSASATVLGAYLVPPSLTY